MPQDIAAICGSLRTGSFNQALLASAIEMQEKHGLRISQVNISGFPLFCADLEAQPPSEVIAAKALVSASDCILLVSPEHNYGVPGVLKNAIDWLSRPAGDATLRGRPMAVMGASTGYMGTVRAQLAWRQMWHYFDQPVFSGAQMFLPSAREAVVDGRVTNPEALERLDRFLGGLSAWLEGR